MRAPLDDRGKTVGGPWEGRGRNIGSQWRAPEGTIINNVQYMYTI